MQKKKIFITILIVLIVLIAGICIWIFGFKIPHDKALDNYINAAESYNKNIPAYNDAVKQFNTSVQSITNENKKLDDVINNAQNVINMGEIPYDSDTIPTLSASILNGQNSKINTPNLAEELISIEINDETKKMSTKELKTKTSELIQQTQNLDSQSEALINSEEIAKIPDYSLVIEEIQTNQKALEDSIKINKQIMNPSELFVKNKLSNIDIITDMISVTEDNDPNGKLNKSGGYTSTVFFSVSLLDQSLIYGDTLIDKGTDAGGSIEVYTTVEDAQKREAYLASFDGSVLATGSHTILGTIVIRTSDELTASQQKELENQIIDSFTTL